VTALFEDGHMLGDATTLDLLSEIKSAQESRPWNMGRFTKNLVKKPDLRLLLILLEKDSVLKEHHADGTIAIQVIRGSILVTAKDETYTLSAYSVLALTASIKHEVRATEESAFLLTISWPTGEALKAMQHRGY
jgi:quercetin dioxygenase-like cupin family protein